MDISIKLLGVLILVMIGCNKNAREGFSFERMDYLGKELRTDGFYWREVRPNEYLTFFLYRNGIYFNDAIHDSSSLAELKRTFSKSSFTWHYDWVYSWGLYKINKNSLVIEEWISGDVGPYRVLKREGKILNDTTVVFNDDHFGTMRFESFSPKPDSTNMFIK